MLSKITNSVDKYNTEAEAIEDFIERLRQIKQYDLNRQIKREVDAVQVRRELLRLLAIDEEVKNYA